MKKILFIVISIVFMACTKKPVAKPDNLLTIETMQEIIYELAILQAAESHKPQILNANNIKVKNYIYKKYNIDSTTYFQNYKYYASDIKAFKKIYKQVSERIVNQKSEIDTILKSQKIEIVDEVPTYIPQID